MIDFNQTVGSNLKRIREELGFSLDRVADLTGVSKSMLGQIERGETSPTITTLWKIANGLKVSFTALTKPKEQSVSIIKEVDITPMTADQGRYSLYPIFPFDPSKGFEVYSVKLESGCVFHAEGHIKGEEYIIVFDGILEITIADETHRITKGNALKFIADKPHTYANPGETTTSVSMIIYYPR